MIYTEMNNCINRNVLLIATLLVTIHIDFKLKIKICCQSYLSPVTNLEILMSMFTRYSQT